MNDTLKIQIDVKNNAEDLQRYMIDMQNWEEEMKRKETGLKTSCNNKVTDVSAPRNKIKRNMTDGKGDGKHVKEDKKAKKISAYDYAAWDKYDADKACDELDMNSEKNDKEIIEESQLEITEPKDKKVEKNYGNSDGEKAGVDKNNLRNIDEALYEKQLGNVFVRKQQWEEAIRCYSRAIELDKENAIYYANRALCFMKLKNFRSAEVDSTVAIQLDNTYIKAYQRRAFARFSLGQLKEALSDYKEVIRLEPSNSQAKSEIMKIEKKLSEDNSKIGKCEKKTFDPKTIFKSAEKAKAPAKSNQAKAKTTSKPQEVVNVSANKQKVKEEVKEKNKPEEVCVAKESVISPKKETKVKEDRPEIKEKDDPFGPIPDGFTAVKPIRVPPHLRSKKLPRRIPVKDTTSEAETFNEFVSISNELMTDKVEAEAKPECIPVTPTAEEMPDLNTLENLPKPGTFLQFQHGWKIVKKHPQHAVDYLQKTTPKNLYKILRHNLESDLFSELLSILSFAAKTNQDMVATVLLELTGVDRFGSLVLFFSESDKKNLMDCMASLEGTGSSYKVKELKKFYRL